MKKIPFIFFFFISVKLIIAQTSIASFTPVKDAYINSFEEQTNYGVSTILNAQSWESDEGPFTERILMQFDFGSLPSNAFIIRADLKLISNGHDFNQGGINSGVLYFITESWDESEVNWAEQPMTTQEMAVLISEPSTNNSDVTIDLTNWARKELAGTNDHSNNGFLIRLEEESPNALLSFYSSDHSNQNVRPQLEIEYRIPSPMVSFIKTTYVNTDFQNSASVEISMLEGDSPFSFNWNPNSESTSHLSGLNSGTYTVTITDDNQLTETKIIGLGYDPSWKAENNGKYEINSGYVKKTSKSSSWSGILESNQILSTDGWIEYTVENYSGRKMIGFGQLNVSAYDDWKDIEYGIYLKSDNTINLVKSGVQFFLTNYSIGDVIRIERQGVNFEIHKNGSSLALSSTALTGGMVGDIISKLVMFDPNTLMGNVRTSYGDNMVIFVDAIHEGHNNEAELNLSVYGGTEPYTYNWSNSSNSKNLIGINQGTYTVTVTDGNGSKKIKSGIIKSGVDDNWNWNVTKTFDNKENLQSANKVYIDQLENVIQSQTYLISSNNILVAQNVHDIHNRSSLTSLPAPNFNNSFEFDNSFLQESDGVEYSYTSFDLPNSSSNISGEKNNPKPVYSQNKGGVGWYYSNLNNSEKYVASTNFPYVKSNYSNIIPNTIISSSKSHNSLKMGSGKEVTSIEMPVAGELLYFFGTYGGWVINQNLEGFGMIYDPTTGVAPIWQTGFPDKTPLIKRANKTIYKDEDGIETIIFRDIEGKLIGSCLSGTNDQNQNVNMLKVSSMIDHIEAGSFVDVHIPSGCENSILPFKKASGVKDYSIYDLITENEIYNGDGQSVVFPINGSGLYRITDNTGGNVTEIKYEVNYYNISLNYYDQLGRLIGTVSPKGIDLNTDLSGISINSSEISQDMDYDISHPNDKWKFINSSSHHHKFDYLTSSNPDPINKLQYSNLLVYVAKKTDNPAFTVNDVNDGVTVPTTESELPGDYYPSFDGNVINSVDRMSNDDVYKFEDDPNDPNNPYRNPYPCFQVPHGLIKYQFKFEVVLHAEYQKNGVTVIERLGKVPNTGPGTGVPVRYYGPIEITAYQKYNQFWGQGNLEWGFHSSWNNGSTSTYVDMGISQRIVDGSTIWSVGNEISKTISKIIVEIVDIEGTETIATAHNPGGHCLYYTWVYAPYNNFQAVEDDLQVRIKGVTTIIKKDLAPEHELNDLYVYNSLGQLVRKWNYDSKTTDYLYSEAGLLRFSQNQEQKNSSPKRFSYTNYDSKFRVIELGEGIEGNSQNLRFQNYDESISLNASDVALNNNAVLNNISSIQLNDNEKNDPSYYVYDEAYPTIGSYSSLSHIGNNYSQKRLWNQLSYSYNKNNNSIQNLTIYSYDSYGRVEWTIQDINGLGVKTKNILYDDRGNLQKVTFQKYDPNEFFEFLYNYDIENRIKKTYSRSTATESYNKEAEYFYYLHGPLKRVELANNLQGIDYIYNSIGQLKSINSPELGNEGSTLFEDPGNDGNNGFFEDVFGMTLDYFSGDYDREGTYINSGSDYRDRFNGNIKGIRWNTKNQTAGLWAGKEMHWMYSFEYNKKGWLKSADFGKYGPQCQNLSSSDDPCLLLGGPSYLFDPNDAYKVDNLTYDKVGNIETLRRRATNGVLMDDFTYNYDQTETNRLNSLHDAIAISSFDDLNNQSNEPYEYDAIGRMTKDESSNQKLIYNSLGLVKEVQKSYQSNFVPVVKYFYDENGYRIAKETYDNNGVNAILKTWYVGGVKVYQDLTAATSQFSYEYDIVAANRIGKAIRNDGVLAINRTYELTDHLGNVRAIVGKDGSGGLILKGYSDYYPFGSEMPGRKFVSGDEYNHKYQGQFTEHDEEVNWDAFELRNWDGRLARWTSIDPYNQFHSPYIGMGNNPINSIDPDGGWIKGAGFFRNLFQSDQRIVTDMANNSGGILTQDSRGYTITNVTSEVSLLKDGTTMNTLSSTERFFPQKAPLSDRIRTSLIKTQIGDAHTLEINGTIAGGGGFGFKLGFGRDAYGRWFDYNSVGPALGYEASIGASYSNHTGINSNQRIRANDLRENSVEIGGGSIIDGSYGSSFDRNGFGTVRSTSVGGSFGFGGSVRFYNTSVNVW